MSCDVDHRHGLDPELLWLCAEVQPQQPGSAEGEDGLQMARQELEPTPQLHAADDPIY